MIEATIGLLRNTGFAGAGINDVIKTSGAPKGSLYHFFPQGKQQLVSEALQVYAARVLKVIEEGLSGGEDPGGKVRALFGVFARRLEASRFRASCAAGAVSLDLEDDLEAIRLIIAVAFSQWIDMIAGQLNLPDPERGRAFADLMLTTIEGAYIRGRAERSSRPFIEAGQWLAQLAELLATAAPRDAA